VRVSDECIHMIKHHEGVKATAYRCPARLWTVGVGHVIDPNHARVPFADRLSLELPAGWNRTLSQDEIDDILRKDLTRFEAGVKRLCPGELTQGQFDALVSFAFNVGLGSLQKSSLRMKHNRGDFEGAAEEFLKWSKAGGKVLKGLLKRRQDERALYLS
jgi:lysozyme